MALPGDELNRHRLADFFFDYRWPLSLLLAAGLGWLVVSGFGAAKARSQAVDTLAGVRPGPAGSPLKVLDPRMDIWFSQDDAALAAFKKIDQGFVGDDFVLLVLQDETDPMGVFGSDALAAIARLTEECLRIPGVRHVRSLTSLPWIRWGEITGADGRSERGLLVSDLFVGDPSGYDEASRLRRLIDVLGGTKAAALVGEEKVRSLIGPSLALSDIIGEPSSVGTLVSADGRMAAIQVQMTRRRPTTEEVVAAFPVGDPGALVGSELAEAEGQFRTLQGLDRTLRIEAGLARPSAGRTTLETRIAAMPDPSERRRWETSLADRTAAHLQDPDGNWVRLWDEYKREQDGTLTPLHGSPPPAVGWSPIPRGRFSVMTAGTAYFNRNFFEVGQRDLKFVGLMFLVLALALFSVFRSVGGVVGPLSVIFGAIVGTVCTTWYLGEFLDNLTAIVPNMLAAVGMGDGVHLMASYALYRSRGGWESPHELVRAVVRANSLPVLLTSVTTAIGFGSLVLAGMIPLVKLGTVAPVGVALAYLLSMTWIPAALSLVPLAADPEEDATASAPVEAGDRKAPSERVRSYVGWVIENRLAIVSVAVLVTAAAGAGVLRLVIDSDPRTQLPPGDPLLVQGDLIEARLGGISDLELLFEAIEPEGAAPDIDALEARRAGLEIARAKGALSARETTELAEVTAALRMARRRRIAVSPEFLGRLTAFVDRLREESRKPESALALLTEVTSPLDILRKIHQVQNENRPEAYRVPTDDDVAAAAREPRVVYDDVFDEWSYHPPQDGGSLVAQYYLQYETGARPGENLSSQIRADRKALRVQGRLHLEGNELTLAAIDKVREIAWEEFPDLAGTPEARQSGAAISSLEITGRALLFAEVGRRFIVTFLESVGVALVLITLVIIVTFRSVRYGLISLIPNVLPIVLPLGVLGWIGVPLGPAAALVASIALGVCVDDTIHFFTKYTQAHGRDLDVREALEYSLGEVGWALTITSLVLMLGFSALLLSDFFPSYRMGQLATAMIGLAWVADLVVTPAVLAIFATGELTEREDSVMTLRIRSLIQGVAAALFVAVLAAAPPPPRPEPPVFDTSDPAVYGRQLMAYSETLDDGWNDEVSVSSMTLFDAGGNSVTRSVSQMTLERPGGDKSVVRFRTPAEIKGVAALTHEHTGGSDDSWLYLPASRRVRRMSGANKTASFQGTEFTFEDLGQIEEADYTWTFLGKEALDGGGEAFRVEGLPKASDSGYSRIIVWIHTEHYRFLRTDYFDKAGEPFKRMDIEGWELFHGRWWRPRVMEMSNLQSRKRTRMQFSKRFLDLARYPDARTGKPRTGLTDEHFTKRRLEGR